MDHSEKPKILIVEDEPDLRDIVRDMLHELNLNILVAGDGLEALEVLKHHKVTAIISDISMPRMTGLELLAELRNQELDIPFVLLSGYSGSNNLKKALQLGAIDFIEKPFELMQLTDIIRRVIQFGQAENALLSEMRNLEAAVKVVSDTTESYRTACKALYSSSQIKKISNKAAS